MDAVGDIEDLRHVVRDQDDAHPAIAQVLDELEHASRLIDTEGGRRLVEDDDLAAEGSGACHGDRLALTAREGLDRLRDALDGEHAKVVQALGRLRAHPLLVQAPEDLAENPLLADLTTEVEVLGDVQHGGHGQGLVDGLHPHGAGVVGRLEGHFLAVDEHLAGVGREGTGEALDERGLAGTVVAHHREHLAGVELEVAVGEADDPAEGLVEVLGLDDGLGGGRCGHAFTFRIH